MIACCCGRHGTANSSPISTVAEGYGVTRGAQEPTVKKAKRQNRVSGGRNH